MVDKDALNKEPEKKTLITELDTRQENSHTHIYIYIYQTLRQIKTIWVNLITIF